MQIRQPSNGKSLSWGNHLFAELVSPHSHSLQKPSFSSTPSSILAPRLHPALQQEVSSTQRKLLWRQKTCIPSPRASDNVIGHLLTLYSFCIFFPLCRGSKAVRCTVIKCSQASCYMTCTKIRNKQSYGCSIRLMEELENSPGKWQADPLARILPPVSVGGHLQQQNGPFWH